MLKDYSFFKFIIVGIINTICGGSLIFILYNAAGLGYWLSSATSYTLITILSFFLNKYFTFSVKEWHLFMVVAFIMNIVFSYFIAYGLAKPIINYLLSSSPIKFRENVALFTGICLFAGINYIGQRFVVFKKIKS